MFFPNRKRDAQAQVRGSRRAPALLFLESEVGFGKAYPTYSRLVSQYGAVPSVTTNTYDSLGNLKTSRDGQSNTTTYDYDAQGRVKTVTQPGSAATTLSYNADGSVATIADGEGGLTQLGYDGAGHLTTLTDASGNTRTLTPNAAGQVLSIKDGLGRTTTFTHDALGNRKTATDAGGRATSFGYDALGRLTSVTDALGNVTRTEYDAEGRVTARVDVRGNRTEYHFDKAGRLSETVGPDGAVTSYGYCADQGAPSCSGGSCGGSSGQACEIVDPLGNVTTLKLDTLGREITRTDPLGHFTATKYQSNGLVQQVLDQLGNGTNYSYDAAGRLKSAAPAAGGSSYGYDGRGNRTQVYDARNTLAASYTYDHANRVLTETNPLQQVTAYTYDKAGNRRTKTDGNGKVTSYAYDANRRLQTVTFFDGTTYSYDYDARGNRTLEMGSTHERHLAYDDLNRLKQVTDTTLGKVIDHTYDAAGNRSTMTADGLTTSYKYDKANRVIEVDDPEGGVTRLTYDLADNRKTVRYPNGVVASYGYDTANRLTSIVYAGAQGQVLQSFSYILDAVGNRTRKTFADGSFEQYGYDAGNRLTSVTYPGGRTVTYGLDPVGNRSTVNDQVASGTGLYSSYVVNAFNQVTSMTPDVYHPAPIAYAYDANGNLTTETQGSSVRTYSYDADNRLRQVGLPGGNVDSFEYDANGLRTKKVDSTGTTRYLLDGPSVVAEYDDLGTRKAFHVNNPQRIDEVFSAAVLFNGQPNKVYPLTDGLGSVYALVARNGTVVRTNSYDVYGVRSSSGTGPQLAMGFTGREHDESGLNYHRDRYLMPGMGRWTQADRLRMVDGPNVYAYAAANPVNLVDALGFCFTEAFAREFEFSLNANKAFFSYGPWSEGFFRGFTTEKVIKTIVGVFVGRVLVRDLGLASMGDLFSRILKPLLFGGAIEYSVGYGWATLGVGGTVAAAVAAAVLKAMLLTGVFVASVIAGSAINAAIWAAFDDQPCIKECEP
jgi:RHS repeat-associated protein